MKEMASKEIRYSLYFALLLLAPELAFANIIIPTLVVSVPIMWAFLIAVIAVESAVLIKLWPQVKVSSILISTSLGNFVSTLIGIPLAWCLYYFGLTLPLSGLVYSFLSDIENEWLTFLTLPFGLILQAPIIISLNDWVETYIKFVLMLPPAYFLSYWIEYGFTDIKELNQDQVLKGVRTANRASYLFVLLIVTTCFAIMANNDTGWLNLMWERLLRKAMWLALLLP
jgi:hypothetical protein